jgi:hypothetical protein
MHRPLNHRLMEGNVHMNVTPHSDSAQVNGEARYGEGWKVVLVFVLLLLTPLGLYVMHRFEQLGEGGVELRAVAPVNLPAAPVVVEGEVALEDVPAEASSSLIARAHMGSLVETFSWLGFWRRDTGASDEEIVLVAEEFVVRYASYSNRDKYANLLGLRSMMTADFWQRTGAVIVATEAEPEKQIDFYGVSSGVQMSELRHRSAGQANVLVEVNQAHVREGGEDRGDVAYEVSLRQIGQRWLIDDVQQI